VTPRSNPF